MKRRLLDDLIFEAKKIHGDKYDYTKYVYFGINKIGTIICKKCNREFDQSFAAHIKLSHGCPYCKGGIKKDIKFYLERAKEIHGDKYDYSLVDYKNSRTNVKILCKKCNRVFEQNFDNHINKKQGCPVCRYDIVRDKKLLGKELFIERAKEIHGDKYDYSLVDYKGNSSKVKIFCKECHEYFFQKPINHLYKEAGCQKCKSSHGETKIRNFLLRNNILFEEQKRFDDCRNKRPLPFDFYIPSLNYCIEYQGIQHYEISKMWGGEEALKKQKERDKIKKDFCLLKNINLLEIKFDDVVEDCLIRHLALANNPS